MKAMILAAGRGERMRPLTDTCPKPLLHAGGKPLIAWHLERLACTGFRDIVINHAHLGAQIEATLADGAAWGTSIRYSPESAGALETAGGIAHALPLLGSDPFLVINGDIFCDWAPTAVQLADRDLAHLILVPNPAHHPEGDFTLDGSRVGAGGDVASGQTAPNAESIAPRFTFSGIGIYRPELFADIAPRSVTKLAPLLREAMAQGRVSGELHSGRWTDVGTPQRLVELDDALRIVAHPIIKP